MSSTVQLRLLLALVALAAAVVPGALRQAARAYVPTGAMWFATTITEADGTTLHADVFRPAGLAANDRTPVILQVSPYLGTGPDVGGDPGGWHRPKFLGWDLEKAGIFARGYTYVEVALRGYGGSSGCPDLGGPGEQRDVRTAVEWAAAQQWSNGRVGMWGQSYDAWTQVMALATKPRGLAAVVMQSPVVDPLKAVAMNGVRYADLFGYGASEYFAALSAEPPGAYAVADPPDPGYAQQAAPTDPTCAPANAVGFASTDHTTAYWKQRDLLAAAAGTKVPTMMAFGLVDEQVHPTQFLDLWRSLRGPRELFIGQWGHVVADPAAYPPQAGYPADLVGRDAFLSQALNWLDRYLAGDSAAPVGDDPVVTVEDGAGQWRSEPDWPGNSSYRLSVPLTNGSYHDIPGNDAENKGDAPYPGSSTATPAEASGVGIWTVGAPTAGSRLAGVATVHATATAAVVGGHLVVLLYDVAQDGRARLITRGATVLSGSGPVTLDLWPQDWRLAPQHRIGVLLTSADDSTFTPGSTGQTVTITHATLSLPCIRRAGPALAGSPSAAVDNHAPIHVPPSAISAGASWPGCSTTQ